MSGFIGIIIGALIFSSAVGIIAGRTVTSHEAHPFPVAVTYVPGGAAVMYVRRARHER